MTTPTKKESEGRMIKTKVINRGLCCNSCQEEVNLHGCWKCHFKFCEDDEIYCINHSQSDCEHYHIECKPKND